jgi:hypothetical protein
MKARIAFVVLAAGLMGCQSEHVADTSPNRDIPRTAVYTKEGQGRLWYQAALDGVAYVYDADTTQLVFATAMLKEQRLVVDSQRSRATVEGKPVYEKPLPRTHTYRVYFEPGGKLAPPPKEPAPLELKPPTAAPATAPAS